MSATDPGAGERACDEDFGHPGSKPHPPHDWDASVQDRQGAPWREETFRCPGVPAKPDAGDAEALTEAEREQVALACDAMFDFGDTWIRFLRDGNETVLLPVVERILAARLAAVRREAEAGVDAVLVCPHEGSGRHYYRIDATCQRCEMPSWVEAAVRAARLGGA